MIDFNNDYRIGENPFSLDLLGPGNVLCYAIGKGFHTYYNIKNDARLYKDLIDRIIPDDFSLLDRRRLFNLRKPYPQIPHTLNNILMHISCGTEVMYESTDEIIEDLNRCLQAFS